MHDPEYAAAEFARFAEGVGLDLDVDDPEDKRALDKVRGYIAKGWITVSDDGGAATYSLRRPNPPFATATFTEPTGRNMKALDKASEGQNMTRLYAFVASLIGEPEASISKVRKADLEVLTSVARLFLG